MVQGRLGAYWHTHRRAPRAVRRNGDILWAQLLIATWAASSAAAGGEWPVGSCPWLVVGNVFGEAQLVYRWPADGPARSRRSVCPGFMYCI